MDFRVYFQRNKDRAWICMGMEAQIAKEGSIISNSKNRKRIMSGDQALRKIYELNDEQIQARLAKISKVCITMLDRLQEKWKHLGDAAVDLVIDGGGKVWVLEIQIDYAAEIKCGRTEDEQRVLPSILPTPFEYAKALTGFPMH